VSLYARVFWRNSRSTNTRFIRTWTSNQTPTWTAWPDSPYMPPVLVKLIGTTAMNTYAVTASSPINHKIHNLII
jgi:hypothetical protein